MSPPLSGRGFVRRQVHPDQTKAVKGQNSKTLVTAGTIKRPLPCPVKWDRKIEDFSQREKKKQSKRRRKKIRTKTERKGKKTKKERRVSSKEHAPIDRLPSLPLQKSHISPKNANENFPSGTITIQGRLPQSH